MFFHKEVHPSFFYAFIIMLQVLSFILSPIFYLFYGLVFLITHLIQYVAHRLGGEKARVKVIEGLNFILSSGLLIIGARMQVKGKENRPDNSRPIIIVSNHQSLYDIPIIGYLFRKNNVKFVAKSSLGKGIPTVSYNLVHGKSALIDRSNGAQAVREIFKLGRLINQQKYAACIYPEGTRTKTGRVKKFQSAGIATLLRAAPDALIVPFAIKGHAELIAKSNIWLKVGQNISYTIFPAINPKGMDVEELTANLQAMIKEEVEG